ncbi:MAG: AsmA family protein [Xanthobacteraceae bacterium]|nr:AsmA family protein [Xanthobacteraceae bacterium]
MQTTLLGLAIALILALLAALIGPYFIHWNDHRAFFEAEAGRLVGLKVKVGGDIDAKLLPFPAVTLGRIDIGPAGEASRLRAHSLRIELSLGALMRGELRATEMKLVTPQVKLGLDAQGQIDWPAMALATETLSIDRLSIENGQATLSDAASGSTVVLDQLGFTGEVRSLAGPIRGEGAFLSRGTLYTYDVSAGRAGADGSRVRFSLKTNDQPVIFEADGTLAFERAAPRFDGTLTLARPAVSVAASGRAVASEPWRLSSKVKATTASATLDEVSFQYGPEERALTLNGAAEFTFGRRPQMQGTLSARQVDLDRLLATPGTARRLPLSAVQAFGDMLGSALRPSWPVQLALKVDAMTVGGGIMQAVGTELRSDGVTWTVDKLEFRAPGLTHIKIDGRLFALGKGLGFVGGAALDSNDPRNLLAWLGGGPAPAAPIKPWHAIGDVTLSAGRIAVERLQTQTERGTIEGDVSYMWPSDGQAGRVEADLRMAELDLDAAIATGQSALAGLGIERPREAKLVIEAARAKFAGLDARNISTRLTLDAEGLAIDRLSIGDFADASFIATGRLQTLPAPGGSITIYLDARDLNGVIALADKFAPALADPLRRLATRQKTATLRAAVSLDSSGSAAATGKVELTGQLGAVKVSLTANATGKREAFSLADPGALAGTNVRIDNQLASDDSGALLMLLGLDRMIAAEPRPAKLTLAASGPLGRDLRFEGRLDAGPIDASGKGVIRSADDQPATVALDQFAGTFGGNKVQGRLTLRTGDPARIDGVIEAESLQAPAIVAATIGMPMRRDASAAGWSIEPFVWSTPRLAGKIEFKSQRAVLLPGVAAQQLSGVARFSAAEVLFEEISGEMAKGRLEGRLAIANGSEGMSARLRVALLDADPGALFPGAERSAMSGKLVMQTELEGAGRSPAAFMGSLTGFGNVTLERAQLGGLNPGVFGAVSRAIELNVPLGGNKIREFVTGMLDNGPLPVTRASARIGVSAGQARFSDITVQSTGAELQASASVDLSDATLDARLTLNGLPPSPGAQRPAVLVALKGALPSPQRTVDVSLLTSWLTLRAVEQQSKQIDAMEQAARDAATRANPTATGPDRPTPVPVAPDAPDIVPSTVPSTVPSAPGGGSGAQTPALPPPIDISPASRSRIAPRAEGSAPARGGLRPPGLVGAQN